jgi:hypothetical protein
METIPGGAYLVGDKWVDANGKPLSKEAISAAAELLGVELEKPKAEKPKKEEPTK